MPAVCTDPECHFSFGSLTTYVLLAQHQSMPMTMRKRNPPTAYATTAVVHWFRRDLRLHDNLALNSALRSAAQKNARFLPVFVFDSAAHTCINSGVNRWRFLHQSVMALRNRVSRSLNVDLVVLQGRAVDVLPPLCSRAQASELHFEIDPAIPGVEYDDAVAQALAKEGVTIVRSEGHTLYEPSTLLLKSTGGIAPCSMSAFLGSVNRAGLPNTAVALASERGLKHGVECPTPPTLADLGFPNAHSLPPLVTPGGEESALRTMIKYLGRERGRVAAKFSKPDTSPATFGPTRDTTLLSPYLSHGCLSSRMFYHKLLEVEKKFKPAPMIQTRLTGQMLWREHFWLLGRTTPNFHNEENPLCRKIPWDRSPRAHEHLAAWREARTGFPWIDALMTQLRTEGFVHHLGR